MLNFLALLGWSPGDDIEVMTLAADDRAVLASTDCQKKAAIFDTKKLEWMNGQHLSLMPLEELEPLVTPRDRRGRTRHRGRARERGASGISRCSTCSRCARARSTTSCVRRRPYFRDDDRCTTPTPSRSSGRIARRRARSSRRRATRSRRVADWEPAALEDALRAWPSSAASATAGKIFQPLRVALTGLGREPRDLRGARRCSDASARWRGSTTPCVYLRSA